MRHPGWGPAARYALPGEWTIIDRPDPAMDLHLRLMAETAEEALRGVRASEEFSIRRVTEAAPAPGATPLRRLARIVGWLLRRRR